MGRTILITGANRGIGFAIAQSLAHKCLPTDMLVLACRSRGAGDDAVRRLHDMTTTPQQLPQLEVVEIDVASDESVRAAARTVEERVGKIDVLINNAAGIILDRDNNDPNTVTRAHLVRTFNVNVAGVAMVMDAFIPLLLKSSSPSSSSSSDRPTERERFEPRIINVSSSVGSMARALRTPGTFTPPWEMGYSVSKAALNRLTLEYMKLHPGISFYLVCPGHCSTGLNDFQGKKDPVDGARVVVELVLAERGRYGFGFWRFDDDEEDQGGMGECGW